MTRCRLFFRHRVHTFAANRYEQMRTLYGQTERGLKDICDELHMPRFAAGQIARWLYRRRVASFDEMTDISAANRELLARSFTLGLSAPLRESVSADGTKKYLFRTSEGAFVESAYIPDGDRATLCV